MTQTEAPPATARRIHPAWWAAAATFLALLGAAAFRSTPSVMIEPLRAEFGWSIGTISFALSVNLALFGITAPFAAALMERFGVRRVVSLALLMVAVGSGLTVFMTASWQLVMLWGVIVGLGTGSMAMALVATVVGRWFVARRGLVSGILTAAIARHLQEPAGNPVFVSDRITYTLDGTAVVADRATILGSMMEIRTERTATGLLLNWGAT